MALGLAIDEAFAVGEFDEGLGFAEVGENHGEAVDLAGFFPDADVAGGDFLDADVGFIFPGAGFGEDFVLGRVFEDFGGGGGDGAGGVEGAGVVGVGGDTAVEDHEGEYAAEEDEHGAFDELDPGGGDHAGGDDDEGDDEADDDDAGGEGRDGESGEVEFGNAEEGLDECAGADHLGDEVEDGDDEGGDGGGEFDAAGVEAGVEGVGEGVFAEAFDGFSDDEESDDPSGEEADGVKETVIAVEGDHAADAEEGGGGEVIAGEGDAVDEPVDLPVGGEVALGGFGFASEVDGEAEDGADEGGEDEHGSEREGVDHG